MSSRLKPPARSSEDYVTTAIGAIFVTKPVSIALPPPIGTLRFAPPIDASGKSIPVPIYKCLIPICPEEFNPETSWEPLIHETVRLFWEDQLLPKLRTSSQRRIEICRKILLHLARNNKSQRKILLPDGMECQLRFESLLTISDIASEIREDESVVRGLYAFHLKQSERHTPSPPKKPGRYSSTVVGLIAAQSSGRIKLDPFGTIYWEPETLPSGQHRERHLFIDTIPVLPEECCGIASVVQKERALLIDRFWDMMLSDLIGYQKFPGLTIAALKERLRRVIGTTSGQDLLPKSLIARIDFDDMRPVEEQFPGIIADEIAIRKAMSLQWPRLP